MSEKIQWLGHASFRIQTIFEGQTFVIYIDPWLSNPFAPKDLDATDADLILITHGHWDH
jgi:L-ascorbate metabolism protein UlaG (beta-lactamase superfamily)